MKITRTNITIRELVEGYSDKGESGITGFNGKLNIRPAYQREFIYGEKERNAVIDSVSKGFPLNTMFWAENDDGTYELLDGQQRTISISQFVTNEFSMKNFLEKPDCYFKNLSDDNKNKILDYVLDIYICKGNNDEKLSWFRTINIAGMKLTDQELLNATYTGSWLSSAKKYFSSSNCPAYTHSKDYVKGSPIRQELLETALDWISKGSIESYMANHQNDRYADELWNYFYGVIDWVKKTFPKYRKEMKGLNWGHMFSEYSKNTYDIIDLESKVKELMADDEVTDKKGIYEYVLSNGDEGIARRLSKRAFSENDKRTAYEKQNGICPICGEHHDYEDMDGDHIIPWWRGGKTVSSNLQMVCRKCNSGKGGKMTN